MATDEEQAQRKWPWYFYLLVPLTVTLVTLALIELLLVLFAPVPASMSTNMYYRADPVTGFAHAPGAVGRYPTGISAVANSKGLRDHETTLEKPADTRRILVLGDSFTVGVNVEMEDAYPQVLERLLNEGAASTVEVINAAVGGTSPFQYAQYFDHYGEDYSPDEVLVGFFVGNDTYDLAQSVEDLATAVNGQRVSRKAAAGNFVKLRIMLHQHSNLVRLVQGASLIEVSAMRQDCEDFSDNLIGIAQHRVQNHRIDKGSNRALSANAVNQILRIKQKADSMGIPLTVALIPDELQINEALRKRVMPAEESHHYDFTLPQRLLAEEFAALGIATFDLLPVFLNDPRCLYMNDSHWTPDGNVLAASAIARYLSKPIDERLTPPSAVSRTAVRPRLPKKIPVDEAVSIIQAYVAALQKNKQSASSVLDSTLLPFSKEQVNTAAIVLYLQANDEAEKKSFIGVAKSLALFQPDVGANPISLEGERTDGTPWRSIVEPEMQDIERSFSEYHR